MASIQKPGRFAESTWSNSLFSDGWQTRPQTFDVVEPATGMSLAHVAQATPADAKQAAAQARAAQIEWANAPYETRAKVMREAARILESDGEEIARWIIRETGAVPGKGGFEVGFVTRLLYDASGMPSQPQGLMLPGDGKMSMARRVPLGVVAVISPFNFPFILSMRAVAPALALGNAVVLKPDPRTPITGGLLIARLFEEAGLPKGLLHVLPGGGDVGEVLCTDPNIAMVQFTGSTATGRRIGELAGGHLKKLSLELGGKNSLIILDDADLDLAASNAAWGAFSHQGQICMTTGRILAQRNIIEALAERIVERAQKLPVGNPAQEEVALGPIINERQRDRVHSIVTDSVKAGAKLLTGGSFDRLFYQPTVLANVKPGMRAFEEEMFGPIAALTAFDSDDEAVSLANQTEYGLSAGVLSKSIDRAFSIGNRLRAGLVHVNDQTVNDEGVNPFGGRGTSGNGTNIGGPANWEEFTQWQWFTIKNTPTQYPF